MIVRMLFARGAAISGSYHGSLTSCVSTVVCRGMAHLTASPLDGMMYDKVDIKVTGLRPTQPVTMAAMMQEEADVYISYGHYTSDEDGVVCLSSMPSSDGTYTGCEQMGLFWSLTSEKGARPGLRLRKKDITQPHKMILSVLDNHIEANVRECHENTLAQTTLTRHYMSTDVVRIPVREGRVRAVLFVPNNGQGRYPGLIDLYGSTGGLVEYRAALLASKGFTTLALGYMMYEDLPKSMTIDFDYFEEAIKWFGRHPNVAGKDQVGVVGISKGADIGVDLAVFYDQVKAVAVISGVFCRGLGEHIYKGQRIKGAEVDMAGAKVLPEGLNFRDVFRLGQFEHNAHEVEKADQCQFLILHGTDDCNCDASHAVKLADRFVKHEKNNFSLHLYSNAGHLLEPPYIPFCYASWHRLMGYNIIWGGQCKPHSHAQEDAWQRLNDFFRRVLPKASPESSKL